MPKHILKISLIIFLLYGCNIAISSSIRTDKINPYLLEIMQGSTDNSLIPIYITFNQCLKLHDFNDILYDTPKKQRRQIVINRLINHANLTQNRVLNYIQAQSSGRAQLSEQLWIVNAVVLKAVPSVITEIANGFSEIKQINYDPTYPIEQVIDIYSVSSVFWISPPPEQGCILMNADDCWSLGNKGSGVLAANSDDGFWWKHPDVVRNIWQNLGEDFNNNGKTVEIVTGTGSFFDPGDLNGIDDDNNGKIDDLIGWDFTTNNYNITVASHGSATLGHVVGDGTGGTQTGVSPEAKCILMRNASGYTQQIAAFQYALLMGADVVTSSLSWKWYFNPKPDYSLIRQTTDMSLAAGMIHTNSTSNDGNSVGIPLNISSAGCNPAPWRHPDQLKVGNYSGVIGCGNVDVNTDIIVSSSPWGPTTWGNWSLWGTYTYTILPEHMDYPYSRVPPVEIPDSMGLLKPDVSAPGQGSTSTAGSGTGYQSFGGTSSATPHTAGCVALMLSINPEMLPADIDRVIELTAIEKGDPGKDQRYGAGRIDALIATTSPPVLAEGINGGSDWFIGNTTIPNDTARELVGLKLKNTTSPWIGSVRRMVYNVQGTATTNDVEKYRLFFDVNKNNVVDAGDILLKEVPFTGTLDFAQAIFDSLKFKVTDSLRHVLLAIKTKPGAMATNIVEVGMPENTHLICYYTTNAQTTNFPFGNVPTGISSNEQPVVFSLKQNYPNPFNPTTIIAYSLAKASLVRVRVYDAIGREVAVLLNNVRDAGIHRIEFDANFYNGLSSGVYFYKLEAFSPDKSSIYFSDIKKMVLIK
ncbi:MAG: S8 family serine peptidase [Chlorobi bacterium]|nr:S8 family serine peptidase [Chlorobiota bacterium]